MGLEAHVWLSAIRKLEEPSVVSKRSRRVLVDDTTDRTFVAHGTWVHPVSQEFDLTPVDAQFNWKYKKMGGFVERTGGTRTRTFH